MKTNDESVFPALESVFNSDREAYVYQLTGGLTLRDYFAAKAMQGIVTALAQGIRPSDIGRLGADAYGIADAMLKARKP